MRKKCTCETLFQKVAIPLGYEVDGEPQRKRDEKPADYCAVTLTKAGREIVLRNERCEDGSHENLRTLAHAIGLAFGTPAAKAAPAKVGAT